MILISNNLRGMIDYPEGVVVRINIAWVKDEKQLREYLGTPYDVMLDYPDGRTKPPPPAITYFETLKIAKQCKNVKYFAVSNIESENTAGLYKESLGDISFVPKIETIRGADNIIPIIEQCKPEYVMIDTEDLFLDAKGNVTEYQLKYNYIRSQCGFHDVKVLKIQGVVFGEI